MDAENKILHPFVLEHATYGEGCRTKVHVVNDETEKVLCGLVASDLPYSSGTLAIVDLEWINQPDPENNICKKCKKSATKLLK